MDSSGKKYSRGEFLSLFLRRLQSSPAVIHPPYAADETKFSGVCPDCSGRCVAVCPQKIIKRAVSGIPQLDFSVDGCTFCTACAEACELGVLDQEGAGRISAQIHLDFNTCLAWNGTICQSCEDACPEEAIFFNNMKNPNIRKDVCTSCGFCILVCPVGSIQISAAGGKG